MKFVVWMLNEDRFSNRILYSQSSELKDSALKLRNPNVLRELTKPRTNRIMSIPVLAEKVGVTPGFIYHLINGTSGASPEVAGRISGALSVNRSLLFTAEPGESVSDG